MPDNWVSSVKVSGGINCCLMVYQHPAYKGWKAEFTPGNWNNDAFKRLGASNDAVSSLKVTDQGCPSDNDDVSSCKVTLYEHGGFTGWSATLDEGNYNNARMRGYGVRNDAVSSLKVTGGAKCCAVLYEHGDFNGWSAKFPQGEY